MERVKFDRKMALSIQSLSRVVLPSRCRPLWVVMHPRFLGQPNVFIPVMCGFNGVTFTANVCHFNQSYAGLRLSLHRSIYTPPLLFASERPELVSSFSCKGLLSFTSFASVLSLGMANLLVLFRVLLLWDKNRVCTDRLQCSWRTYSSVT